MRLLKKLIGKTKNRKNELSLEVVEMVLVLCNLVDNQYHLNSEVYILSKISKGLKNWSVSMFVTKKWLEVNDLLRDQYSFKKNIMIKPNEAGFFESSFS